MNTITDKEMLFVLTIFKSPEMEYNANSIAKVIGVSSMGALKIARRLERDKFVVSRKLGRAIFYKLNMDDEYARHYVRFLLRREAEQSPPYVRRWITELKKIKNADSAILFGSVLTKHKGAGDIDVLLVTDKKRFPKLKKEMESINLLNIKRMHPLYQTKEDLKKNIDKGDKPVLSAIKGVAAFGEDLLMKVLER